MKLILETNVAKYYYHHIKGGDLIIIQYTRTKDEQVYTMSEAKRLGIVQTDAEGHRIVVGSNYFYCMRGTTESRRF